MFKLSIGEILLFLIVLFIIAPFDIPKVLKKAGEYIAVLRNLRRQVGDFKNEIGLSTKHEAPTNGSDSQTITASGRPSNRENEVMEGQSLKAVKTCLLDQLARHYDTSQTGFVLRMLFDVSDEIREKAAKTLLSEPVFSFEKRPSLSQRQPENHGVNTESRLPSSFIEALFAEERLRQFSDYISSVPETYFKPVVNYLAEFPGMEILDIKKIFKDDKQKYYEEFLTIRKRYIEKRYPVQVFVVPSYECNAECEYCFSAALRKRYPENLDSGSFAEIIHAVNGNGKIRRIGLMGGEPTIVKNLQKLIDKIEQDGLYFYFPTNGIVDSEIFKDIITRPSLESVTFHIERDDFYTNGKRALLINNIETAVAGNKHVTFRYTIKNPDLSDWLFLDKYMRSMPRFNLSFAVAFPSKAGNNTGISAENLKQFVKKILSLVSYVSNRLPKTAFELAFAKPYPLCYFSENEILMLLSNVKLKNVCEIEKNNFTNNLTVNPDGSFFPCMALNSERYRNTGLSDLDLLESGYYTTVAGLLRTPILGECRRCSLFDRGLCQAACYAYI